MLLNSGATIRSFVPFFELINLEKHYVAMKMGQPHLSLRNLSKIQLSSQTKNPRMPSLSKSRITSIALCPLILTTACTWVEPMENAASVSLAQNADVENCERLGTTTSTVRDQVGWFNRSDERVASELLTLAQNSAISMGGNTLVTTTDPENGSQQFVIYSCPNN